MEHPRRHDDRKTCSSAVDCSGVPLSFGTAPTAGTIGANAANYFPSVKFAIPDERGFTAADLAARRSFKPNGNTANRERPMEINESFVSLFGASVTRDRDACGRSTNVTSGPDEYGLNGICFPAGAGVQNIESSAIGFPSHESYNGSDTFEYNRTPGSVAPPIGTG